MPDCADSARCRLHLALSEPKRRRSVLRRRLGRSGPPAVPVCAVRVQSRQLPQPRGRGLLNIDRFNEMTYAMPELGLPAATGTAAAPASTGTAAIEHNSPTAEFAHAYPFEGGLPHLATRRYQGGERSTLIGAHHPVVILLDVATSVNGRLRVGGRCG